MNARRRFAQFSHQIAPHLSCSRNREFRCSSFAIPACPVCGQCGAVAGPAANLLSGTNLSLTSFFSHFQVSCLVLPLPSAAFVPGCGWRRGKVRNLGGRRSVHDGMDDGLVNLLPPSLPLRCQSLKFSSDLHDISQLLVIKERGEAEGDDGHWVIERERVRSASRAKTHSQNCADEPQNFAPLLLLLLPCPTACSRSG